MGLMKNVSPLLFAVLVAGCGAPSETDKTADSDSDTDTFTGTIPEIDFGSEVNAATITADVGSDALDHHQVVNTVLSGIQLALAEDQVISRLQVDNGSRRSNHCWTAPPVAQTNFTIDYTPCSGDGISGGIHIDDTPQGPVVFQFLNFTFDDSRTIDGAIAFDSAVVGGNLEWQLYNADPDQPSPDNPSPVTVEIDGTPFVYGLTGGASLDLLNDSAAQWGVATVSSLGGDGTVLIGGTDPAELQSSDRPSAAAAGPLIWTSCRCPYAGTQVFEFVMDVTEVTVDLDKLELDDDGEDDPEMSFFKEAQATGTAEVTNVGCGEYETVFTADSEPTVVITAGEMRSQIQLLCDIALLEDGKCIGFLNAADAAGEVVVTLGAAKLQKEAENRVTTSFDSGFCRID